MGMLGASVGGFGSGFIVGLFILLIIVFLFGMRVVTPRQKGLIERLGKYKRTASQGFHWIIPVIDRMIKVDVTENMVDVEPQKIITKDDLNATVDAVVYFRVTEPSKAIYNAQNYRRQISSLARTTLRDIIGKMTLTEANSKRDALNAVLEQELDKQTDAWGIDVIRVELQRIEPPDDVQNSMNNVVIAERDKKAAVDFATAVETKADGDRRSEIKKAEGIKQGLILQAEGEAQAIIQVAKAEAERIQRVNTAIQEYFKNEAQVYKKLETVERALKDGTKYVIDPNTEITNVIAESMAGIVPIEEKEKTTKKE
ncbi:MAG: SPFH domain-containing protein [Candidatus Thermoplasmatota archaeon]|nr:SPFH domain-containing protein [Candidatus Thermoplasmatota archaeon]